MFANRRIAPWKDCRGAAIFEGDTLVHPTGDWGTVVFDADKEPGLEWRVKYLDGEESLWLGNQIGDKGQACVLSVKEPAPGAIAKVKSVLLFLWDFIIPRFVTEDVALDKFAPGEGWDKFEIVCPLRDALPGEEFDAIATVDAFQFLGFGITYRIGNMRPWVRPEACRG